MVLYYILLPLAWLVFHIGFRVHTVGRENLRKVQTKGCIIAPNHVSAIDPVFIVISRFWGRRMLVFAKKELFEINALLTWFFRCSGALCVRGTKEELEIIDRTVEACRAGETLLIFPEHPRKRGQAPAAQERPVCHCGAGRGGCGAGAHPLRYAGREDAAVLPGERHLRRADARRPVRHGEPPGYEGAPGQ